MVNLFSHYLYEYKRGLRNLALYTGSTKEESVIVEKLEKEDVNYHIHQVNGRKINIFFGDAVCVNTVRQMGANLLTNLTPEQDFIVGIMLGYDRLKQCRRYLRRRNLEMKVIKKG